MRKPIDTGKLTDQAYLGRLLTVIINEAGGAAELEAQLPQPLHPTHRIGITGSPGVGKSTLINRLIRELRNEGHRVGVVAVDPTSPFSGGALLGDRIRLADSQGDPDVFIRSLGSRGSLGGVTPAASLVAAVLESAGYTRILIETVGVGQTGYDVICLADTVIALFSPEGGDGIQLLKAGILEVGDIFAVNKSDRPGAELLLKEIIASLDITKVSATEELHHGGMGIQQRHPATNGPDTGNWQPPVLKVCATDGTGIKDLAAECEKHRQWLGSLPSDHPRTRQRLRRELSFLLRSRVGELIHGALSSLIDELAARVHDGKLSMQEAAAELKDALRQRL